MADYDLSRAFERIENSLIDSMMRNFKHHRAEETAEGYNWTQWQVEQLKAFEEYKAKNRKVFGSQFSSLNTRVAEMLRKTKSDAEYAQEQKILNAIQRGYKPKRTSAQSRAEFFKMNERKMNALVKSTTGDLAKAEHAVLRMSNDKYRKAIFDAQVYMNSGAATYAQAVDMAVKDMLSAGLQCVEYKNGARHTLSDYAEMAIRTANKRAYLRGEGEKAQEWGISTVIINRRHGACGRCADFVGMVFIDDVYAGGKKTDGDYPLLSDAIKAGLFHPRCKDGSSLYIEGISTPPGQEVLPKKSQEELSEIERLEQKTSHGKRMQKMYSRLGKYALDPGNKTAYLNKAESWKKYTEIWQGKHEKALANAVESGIIRLHTNGRIFKKPTSYTERGIELPEKLKSYLNELKKEGDFIERDKGTFSMAELSELSKESGVEYACITVKDKSYLIRGNESGTTIPKSIFDSAIQDGGVIDFHSHPHDGDCIPSQSDIEVLGIFQKHTGQQTSYIVSTDKLMSEFDVHGVRVMKNVPSKRGEDYEKLLQELFGGE